MIAKTGMEILLYAPFGSIFRSSIVNTRHFKNYKLNSLMPIQIDHNLTTSAIAFDAINKKLVGFYCPKIGLICVSFLIQLYKEFITRKQFTSLILNCEVSFRDNIPIYHNSCITNVIKGALIVNNKYFKNLPNGSVITKVNNNDIKNVKELNLEIRKALLIRRNGDIISL